MPCVFGADHNLSDMGFKEHCPTKFCSEIKSHRFLQVINYDITMQASIYFCLSMVEENIYRNRTTIN